MILSGKEIQKQIKIGNIVIDPYDEKLINPNSYNLRLHNELLTYTDEILDMKKPLNTESIAIPEDGLILFKRLCRYYYDINPPVTAEYIRIYHDLYDSEEEGDCHG